MKILYATDLESNSDFAIDRAGMLADLLGADLSLLHVAHPTESDQMQERELRRISARLKGRVSPPLWQYGPQPTVYVRAGWPTRILIETMRQVASDLIVLGRHQQSGWDHLVGTMAARALSERQSPVLIVDNIPRGAYHNILLALDGTKASVEVLRAAEALVVKGGQCATIVHASRPLYEGAFRIAS